jgi:hypothetical protein
LEEGEKIIYETKGKFFKDNSVQNKEKLRSTIQWAEENEYNYFIIDEKPTEEYLVEFFFNNK